MVAEFPFVDPQVRYKYISRRLPCLCAKKRLYGVEVGLQIILDCTKTKSTRYDRRALKCHVSVLGDIMKAFPIAEKHAHLQSLCLDLLRVFIYHRNDIRRHACMNELDSSCAALAKGTASLTSLHQLAISTTRVLRIKLLLIDLYSDIAMGIDEAANNPIHVILGIPTRQDATSHTAKSPSKYVALPANASYITHSNWKKRIKLAYSLVQEPTRLNLSEASKIFRGILALHPLGHDPTTIHTNLGSIHLSQNELPEAIQCFHEALKRTPNAWKTHFNLALALFRMNRMLEGKKHLETCLNLQPTFELAKRALDEVNMKWQIEAHAKVDAIATKQNFANELSNAVAVVLTTSKTEPFAAMDHASNTFAVNLSQRCAIPVTQIVPSGWHGVVAALLHRLYVYAALKRIQVIESFEEYRVGEHAQYITMESLDAIVTDITEKPLSHLERKHVHSLFPTGEILYPIFQPNADTLKCIKELKDVGASYNMLFYQRYTTQAMELHHHSKLWQWLELPLHRWIRSINNGRFQVAKFAAIFHKMKLYTVMHIAYEQPRLRPQDFHTLDLSERGTLIYEIFNLRTRIERAAGSMIQGTGRILFAKAYRRRLQEIRRCMDEDHDIQVVQWTELQEKLAIDNRNRILESILNLILTQVIDIVHNRIPSTEKKFCMPIRTELRQRTHIAAASIQQGNMLARQFRPKKVMPLIQRSTLQKRQFSNSTRSPPSSSSRREFGTFFFDVHAACKGKKCPMDSFSRPEGCGEDSFFVSPSIIGVADGVGGWNENGVDPSAISRAMMRYSKQIIQSHDDPSKLPTLEILEKAYTMTLQDNQVEAGSTTACILKIHQDKDGFPLLDYTNLGDSGFVVIRDDKIYYRSEFQSIGLAPFQLAKIPERFRCYGAMESMPHEANNGTIKLKDGDVIVLATDGVWDNFAQDLNEIPPFFPPILSWRRYWHGRIASLVSIVQDKTVRDAAQSVVAASLEHNMKPDDITVIVARISYKPRSKL